MTIPTDYTRCMGLTPTCPLRESCARHRDIPDSISINWVRNLNPDAAEECPYFVRFNPD